MRETTERLFREMDELMDLCTAQFGASDIANMDDETFKALRLSMRIIETSKQLTMECVDMMETQDKKLDKILQLLEKQEKRA